MKYVNLKRNLIIVVLIGSSFFLGRLMSPEKISESIKTVQVIKWKHSTIKITKPDGTIVEEDIKETINEQIKDKHIVFDTKKYLVSISAAPQSNPTYMLSVSKKFILGSYLGVYGRTDGEYGLSVTYRF